MFQKKVTKKRHLELIYPPELQYNNIYKTSVKRLSVFEDITAGTKENSSEYFHGDATAYEHHLTNEIKKADKMDNHRPIAQYVP